MKITNSSDSPYLQDINIALIRIYSDGRMKKLKDKWLQSLDDKSCIDLRDDGQLTFGNIGGIFVILITGIVICICIFIVEIMCRKHNK